MWKVAGSGMAVAAVVLLAACNNLSPAAEPTGEGPLLTSLQVTTGAEQVSFTLQVMNVSGSAVQLTFSSGQSADFVVTRDGERVWRWSDDQGFTQAIREEVLEPGESRTYQAEWRPPPGLSGEFTATGMLTAQEHRPEQAAQFTLP